MKNAGQDLGLNLFPSMDYAIGNLARNQRAAFFSA
jgi:hypothetical protein